MKLEDIKLAILRNTSSNTRKEGIRNYKLGLVTKLKGKKINDIYHIYAIVNEENQIKSYNTHIRVDLKNKRLEGIKCSCDNFKELYIQGSEFMCNHLIGTAYKFFSLASKETDNNTSENNYESLIRGKLSNRITKLRRKISRDEVYYEVGYAVGVVPFKIEENKLRDYLKSISIKKIKFTYDSLEIVAPIIEKDLPLSFTLKSREGYIILTTHKKFPIELNKNKDVYFFNNELYLPSSKQINIYMKFYNKLRSSGEIIYKKTIDNYNKLLEILNVISKEINIREELRDSMARYMKPKIHLYREEDEIYCSAKLQYGSKSYDILKDVKGEKSTLRDYNKESMIIMEIERYKFIKAGGKFKFIGGDEELFKLLEKSEESIYALGEICFENGFDKLKTYNVSDLDVSLYEHDEYIKLSYGIKDFDQSEFNMAFQRYKSKDSFYRSKSGGFINFNDMEIKSFFNLIDILNIDIEEKEAVIEKNKALYLNDIISNSGIKYIKGIDILENINAGFSALKTMDIKQPKELKGTLRSYQLNGLKWMNSISYLELGGILADEMGLGKTIQAISFLLHNKGKRTLIVAPTSLIYNWKEEIGKFAPSLKIGIIHGKKHDRLKVLSNTSDYNVLITTYGTLRLDLEYYKELFFEYYIIDEAQNIKNPRAKITETVKKINARVRFALTGTPIENNLSELWSIFDFIIPEYLFSQKIFEERFVDSKEKEISKLKNLIKPFILRRTKEEVAKELPSKIEQKYIVDMTPHQRALYNGYLKEIKSIISKGHGKVEIFSYLTKLRQICLDPSLIIKDYTGGSCKIDFTLELIKNYIENNRKIILFSQFTSVLDKFSRILREDKIEFFHLDGSTNPKQRLKMVNQFNNNDVKIFLISLKAGGTGLNLTSASVVIHFDPWWNPAAEDQATDRAHRIGQKNIVEVIKLVAKGTIEEKIVAMQEDKRRLIDNIITGELHNSNVINKLSSEEILDLFTKG
ncbi:MAG: DEAD/DEAH box helicase [Clostridium sp.]